MFFRNSYDLQDIVKNVNGGDIKPIGESNYDEKAFERMQDIQTLTEVLIDDLIDVALMSGREASVDEAREEAQAFLKNMIDKISDAIG